MNPQRHSLEARLGVVLQDLHQAIVIRQRQTAHDGAIDDAEGVHRKSYSHGDRQGCDHRHERRLQEHADAVAQVGQQRCHRL